MYTHTHLRGVYAQKIRPGKQTLSYKFGPQRTQSGWQSCIIWDSWLQTADTHPNLLKYKWEFVDSPKRRVQQCSGFRHGLIQPSPGPNISLPLISGHHNSKMILFSSGSFLIMQDSCIIFKAFGKSTCLSPTIVRKNGLHLIGPDQPCACVFLNPSLHPGEGTAEESRPAPKQRVGSTTPEPSALRQRTQGTILAEEGWRMLCYNNPRYPPWAFFSLSPKSTTTTQALELYHSHNN